MVLPTMLPPAHSPTGTHGLACAGLELYGHASVGGWMAEYKQQQAAKSDKATKKRRQGDMKNMNDENNFPTL